MFGQILVTKAIDIACPECKAEPLVMCEGGRIHVTRMLAAAAVTRATNEKARRDAGT